MNESVQGYGGESSHVNGANYRHPSGYPDPYAFFGQFGPRHFLANPQGMPFPPNIYHPFYFNFQNILPQYENKFEERPNEEISNEIGNLENTEIKPTEKVDGSDGSSKRRMKADSYTIALQFLHCYCGGKNSRSNLRSSECVDCGFWLHAGCLRLKQIKQKSCPRCILLNKHRFTSTMGRAIKTGWIDGHQQIEFSEDELKLLRQFVKLFEQGRQCTFYFRLFSIREKKLDRQGSQTGFILNIRHIRQIEELKKMKINLGEANSHLVYYSITCNQSRAKEEILLNAGKVSVGEEWLQEWMSGQGLEEVEIKLINMANGALMVLPVRGHHCRHADVSDYQTMVDQAVDHKVRCETCLEEYGPYDQLAVDQFLLGIIEKKKREGSNDSMRPFSIFYNSRGEYHWRHITPEEQRQMRSNHDFDEDIMGSQENEQSIQAQQDGEQPKDFD